MSHSAVSPSPSAEASLPTVKQEASTTARRYVQWRLDDVGLLLSDLETPGHYERWKRNKSGYSKYVATEVFRDKVYHEAIKFKVRWLESRFHRWHSRLTEPDVEGNERILRVVRDEMQKEFPYYDRCKDIFLPNRTTTPTILPPPAPRLFGNTETAVSGPESSTPHPSTSYETDIPTMDHRDTVSPEPSSSSLLPSLPNPSTTTVNTFKKRRISQGNGNSSMPVEETKLRVLEMELEVKKMEHEERMQEMKLEQLRLEIEMQKLKQARQTTTDFNVTKPHT